MTAAATLALTAEAGARAARAALTPSGGLALSHVTGAPDPPLITDSLDRHLDGVFRRWRDRPALVSRHQGIRRTYGELAGEVDDLAAGLVDIGLRPGDRLAMWSRNTFEWVLTQLAAARAGLVFVGLNPAYRAAELEYALNKVGCKALILAGSSRTDDFPGVLRELAPELERAAIGQLDAPRLPHLRIVSVIGEGVWPGSAPFSELAASARDAPFSPSGAPADPAAADAPAIIQFTSGTTGSPKAATLSHANILNNGYFIGETLRLTERDRVCVPVQLYHSFGMVAGVLAALTHGAAVVLPSERFAAAATLSAIAEERCTALIGPPSIFRSLMEDRAFGSFDLASLRTGIMSCSPCPVELMQRAVAKMGLSEITIAYGMTETSPVSFQSDVDDPLERRIETVGRIRPHLEAKVVDTAGVTNPIGAPGELMVRGYAVMLGYWGDGAGTSEAVDADGWIRTGDLASLDEAGYCRIVGRLKDTIIRGGENIAPTEVENLLSRHPKIVEAHVVGLPDERMGEEICAWIRLRDGETATAAEIRAFCRKTGARSKTPRYIRFVDSFPMTPTGKVQRYVMREQTLAALSRA